MFLGLFVLGGVDGTIVGIIYVCRMQPTPCIAEFEVAAASVLASKAIAVVNSSGIRNLLMTLRAI